MPAYGALPPIEKAWQLGRTVETLDFVRAAEAWLDQPGHKTEDRVVIQSVIRTIKASRANLSRPLTVMEYLTVPELPGV